MPFEDNTEAQPASVANPAPPTLPAEPVRASDNTLVQSEAESTRARALSDAGIHPEDHTQAETPAEADHCKQSSRQHLFEVPGYDLLGKLGAGTYGEVWHARDQVNGSDVAIKFFSHGTSLQWLLLQAEVKQLALVASDPGIIQLKDVEPNASPPYFVMAYAEKGCLAQRLKQGPLPAKEALAIFRQVAQTLAYVHAKGIRHCDLKPGNILLDALGRPRVADFGQAHLSDDASPALGTFFYMAPEQADLTGQIPDARWDVFGLGALFYAMVVGQPPRRAGTIDNDLANTAQLSHRLKRYQEYVRTAPRPTKHRAVPGVDRPLADLIDRCLAVDPAKRPRDAAAVLAELDRMERWRRRRPMLLMALAAPVLLLALLGGLGFWEANSALNKSRTALMEQLGESDRASARLAASKIKDQLERRIHFAEMCAGQEAFKRVAASNELKKAEPTEEERAELRQLLKQYHENSWASNRKGKPLIARCVYLDASGRLLGVYPEPEDRQRYQTNLFKRFAWREFFNGQADKPEQQESAFPPVRSTHVSQPFVTSTGKEGVMIGISTPVFDAAAKDKILGVFLVTVEFEKLSEWLSDVNIKNGFVVIVNDQRNVLYHKNMDQVRPEYLKAPKVWSDCLLYQHVREGLDAHEIYKDPVDDGKTYVAGYALMHKDLPWGVIVQHDHTKAIAPIEEMKREMVAWGLVMLGASLALLVGMGTWLLRREEAAYA